MWGREDELMKRSHKFFYFSPLLVFQPTSEETTKNHHKKRRPQGKVGHESKITFFSPIPFSSSSKDLHLRAVISK
jgi:hypothetical protein